MGRTIAGLALGLVLGGAYERSVSNMALSFAYIDARDCALRYPPLAPNELQCWRARLRNVRMYHRSTVVISAVTREVS